MMTHRIVSRKRLRSLLNALDTSSVDVADVDHPLYDSCREIEVLEALLIGVLSDTVAREVSESSHRLVLGQFADTRAALDAAGQAAGVGHLNAHVRELANAYGVSLDP